MNEHINFPCMSCVYFLLFRSNNSNVCSFCGEC